MKKNIITVLALVLVVAFVGCINVQPAATPTPVPTQAPTPEPTATPAPTAEPTPANYVVGKVVECAGNGIMVNTENGSTILFMTNNLENVEAATGDTVGITYEGNLLESPQATQVVVLEKSNTQQIGGVVFKILDNQLFLQITSSDVLCFILTLETVYNGADYAVAGDTVNITYEGNLAEDPYATVVDILVPNPDRSGTIIEYEDPTSPTNKSLSGIVTKLNNASITVVTSKNKTWKFERNSDTKTTGKYDLEVGAKVRIYYDGYASNNPPAKTIKVLAPYDPTPTTHKTSGIVTNFGGMNLTLDNGFSCDCAYASISGDGQRIPGDYATVTYYTQNGENYATKIKFETVYYSTNPADYNNAVEVDGQGDLIDDAEVVVE